MAPRSQPRVSISAETLVLNFISDFRLQQASGISGRCAASGQRERYFKKALVYSLLFFLLPPSSQRARCNGERVFGAF